MHVFSLATPRVTLVEENQEKNESSTNIDNQKFILGSQQLNYLKASYPI